MGSTPQAACTPGLTSRLLPSLCTHKHLLTDIQHGQLDPRPPCCLSREHLNDGSQFSELRCSPADPGNDLTSFVPISQPDFSSFMPSRGCVRVVRQVQSGSKALAEAEGFQSFLHYQAFMPRPLPRLSQGHRAEFHSQQRSLSSAIK